MKRRSQRLVTIIALTVFLVSLGSMSWWLLCRGAGQHHYESMRGDAPRGPGVPGALDEIDSFESAPVPSVIDDIVKKEREKRSTAEDILMRGLPLMPNPRKEAIEFTASKSLEQVADNLGNIGIMELCRNGNVWGVASGISFWATALPPNTMVLRLIEEGRREPDRVAAVLETAITKKIAHLAEIRKNQPSARAASDKAGYEMHADALSTQFSIAGAFFALANIGRLDNPGLLDRWLVAQKPEGYRTWEMETWLIDCYFRSPKRRSNSHAASHVIMTKDRALVGPKRLFSTWNQPWDVNDPMLIATRVNTKDIQTIEVLSVPMEYPFAFRETVAIQENFRQHVKELGLAGTSTPSGP